MTDWPARLLACIDSDTPAALVTLADQRGSAPRESGASMIVTPATQHGSIGGGQLEWLALAEARSLLVEAQPCTRLVRYPLAASAGQCCGGVVWLSFERITAADRGWLQKAQRITRDGGRWLRVSRHPRGAGEVRVMRGDTLAGADSESIAMYTARELLSRPEGGACLSDRGSDSASLLQAAPEPPMPVFVFGAGHVGRALVETLARLPMHITWMDEREDEFPAQVSENVEIHLTDAPVQAVAGAPDDGVFLVLTHSHALDFALVHAILSRGRFRFLGLIGSRAKRATFAQRLAARGVPAEAITQLTCPIGQPGIRGKSPEVIAVAVAAQLLQLPRTAPVPAAQCPDAGVPA